LPGATNHAAYRFEPALQPPQNQDSKLMGWITVKPEQEPEQRKGVKGDFGAGVGLRNWGGLMGVRVGKPRSGTASANRRWLR